MEILHWQAMARQLQMPDCRMKQKLLRSSVRDLKNILLDWTVYPFFFLVGLTASQLEDCVATLPDKQDSMVGERGVRLSGGQRQRIGIARALYHDPGVLVLDEATSSLDTATESEVMQTVTELHGRKTIIIVAHRLSTVENCDRLYRLDQGRLVEEGSPAVMIANAKITSSN